MTFLAFIFGVAAGASIVGAIAIVFSFCEKHLPLLEDE